ncbi:MAG: DUF2721 domain-containing protein [Candidatus Bathyarchaeia archaeon]|nr:DUF2721 domain-containing protein [Candidatus Bathyarchaeota archaeon]
MRGASKLVTLESVDIIHLFQTVLVPVLMISGIGIFILIIQTRYGRVVDRIRAINNERLKMIRMELTGDLSDVEKKWNYHRLQDLQRQLPILVKRGKMLRDSLRFMFLSIFTFIISSFLIFIEQITKIQTSFAVLTIFTFGMFMVFMACINAIREVSGSFHAVLYDIHTHVPKEYRVKTDLQAWTDDLEPL